MVYRCLTCWNQLCWATAIGVLTTKSPRDKTLGRNCGWGMAVVDAVLGKTQGHPKDGLAKQKCKNFYQRTASRKR